MPRDGEVNPTRGIVLVIGRNQLADTYFASW